MRALALLVLAGCALTSHAAPREVRYFTPERAGEVVPRAHGEPVAAVRIGRITASANLRYAIIHRSSAVEVSPYETLRWTELPEAYVRRALVRALFDDHALAQAVSGSGPTLSVEVVGFEEVSGPPPAARVVLRYELADETTVVARGTLSIERAASSPAIEAIVAAVGRAMTDATAELAFRVEAALLERARHAPDEPYATDPARSREGARAAGWAPPLH